MNNIYSVIGEILDEHIDEKFEITEMVDAPVLAVTCKDRNVTFLSEELSEAECEMIMMQYKFRELLSDLNQDLSIIGYVVGREFFLFAVIMDGESSEISPTRRAHFIELFNSNLANVKLRHVPTVPLVLEFDGAKRALENGSDRRDVEKYTIKAVVELCSGISPMTKSMRKGYAFKSMTTDFSFKALSEGAMMMMGSL